MVECEDCLEALYMAMFYEQYHAWGPLIRYAVVNGRHFHWQA